MKTSKAHPAEEAAAAPPGQEVNPPCGGSWLRQPDGSLVPADEATAQASGIPLAPKPD